jgi:hypothetical protein
MIEELSMPSSIYKLFAQAMAERKQIVCVHGGYRRELCPIILGHKMTGEEVVLVYQFGGNSSRGLSPEGDWRCLRLSGTSDVQLRDGRWRAGSSHRQSQACVDIVDLDVNPASPYKPRRRLKP